MLKETQVLLQNFDRYFLRKYHWRYHLLIVDNHFFDCYSFFLQAQRQHEQLSHSYDLLEIPRNPQLYQQVLMALKQHTQLRIEFRDTHHLVHPGVDRQQDLVHGHQTPTHYRPH
jgi:hypothetical protein